MKTGPAELAERRTRSPYLFPGIVFTAVWLGGSMYFAWRFARRGRFPGPGSDSIAPFIDVWTQTAQVWAGIAFFAAVFVFVFERWREDAARNR